nr:hypothetical protein [uncultured Allomuricauda sp.]
MKNLFTLLFSLVLSISASAQRDFEPGYFIDDNDNKLECLIQNEKWLFSPEEVFYKLNENSEVKSFTVKNCKEFKIGDEGVFMRVSADFPITQSKLKKKELNSDPELIQKTTFVQNVVKGKASLFWFIDNNGIVYLYSKDGGPIKPLLYKKYILEDLKIKENNIFRTQLIKDFECGNQPIIQKTEYRRKSMIKYFEYLNQCSGDTNYVVFERTAKQKANFVIGFKVWAGLEQNQYDTRIPNPDRTFEFESVISPKFGAEFEAFFPYFGYKKVSLFLSGQFSKTDNSFSFPETEVGAVAYNADYSIFELQVGSRYYLDFGEKSSFFIEAALVPDFFGNSTISEDRIVRVVLEDDRLITQDVGTSYKNRFGGSFGLGYSYNRKVYLRAAIRTNQVVLDKSIFFDDSLSRISVSLGYAIF